jgi:CRISPR-associated endonuclease/helicase Cas3
MSFNSVFQKATGDVPYGYQCSLACGADPKPEQPEALGSGTECRSQLVSIPTGLGKTAAVVLAWLWNRVHLKSDQWPRRLVYCLPMRTLVEQTRDEAEKWLTAQGLLWNGKDSHEGKVGLHVLMGGEDNCDWDLHPEREAILIGTQDLLLSKALNRGYGSSRARWPMEFGLLNQDCLWALDEVQLMDVGLATTAQLQAFRQDDQFAGKLLRPCVAWWMSATLQPDWLLSADTCQMVAGLKQAIVCIPPEERNGGLWSVSKPCSHFPVKDAKAWATKAWETHLASTGGEHGRITLIIANTVRTARELHAALEGLSKKAKSKAVELRLIHSRFRGIERNGWREKFLRRSACFAQADRIIVATHVVEAGVDISATTLFAELAPWPSLVQRFGRAARYGGTTTIFVVDRNPSEKAALPYQLSELEASREALAFLPDASLAGLSAFEQEHAELIPRLFPYAPKHLLLRRELEELVDTTPDLSGADLDISRFIRSGEERDVLVFWRDVEPRTVPERSVKAIREELCAVSIGDARVWLTKDGVKNKAWVWDYLEDSWRSCRKEDIYPGQTVLVAHDAGGYDVTEGWTGEAAHRAFAVAAAVVSPTDRRAADATVESEATSQRSWESIAVHGGHVARVIGGLVEEIGLPAAVTRVLRTSARWHDFGKGHPAFQGCIFTTAQHHPGTSDVAKAPATAWRPLRDLYQLPNGERRRGFRHELATTLALFAVLERHAPQHPALLGNHRELLAALGETLAVPSSTVPPTPPEQDILDLDQPSFDLLAYLDCAHHGKVRGAWHAAPADQDYRDRDGRGLPIHGVRERDAIPALLVTASDEKEYLVPEVSLRLEPARIGLSLRTGASWSERIAGLLQSHGPFALAYLEALLRAADIRASRSSATEPPATEAPPAVSHTDAQ